MVNDVTELTRLVELDYYSQVLIITMPGQDPLESFVLTALRYALSDQFFFVDFMQW